MGQTGAFLGPGGMLEDASAYSAAYIYANTMPGPFAHPQVPLDPLTAAVASNRFVMSKCGMWSFSRPHAKVGLIKTENFFFFVVVVVVPPPSSCAFCFALFFFFFFFPPLFFSFVGGLFGKFLVPLASLPHSFPLSFLLVVFLVCFPPGSPLLLGLLRRAVLGAELCRVEAIH